MTHLPTFLICPLLRIAGEGWGGGKAATDSSIARVPLPTSPRKRGKGRLPAIGAMI